MLFKQNEHFTTGELLVLKIILSGVALSALKQQLPHWQELIDKIMFDLNAKRVTDQEIENYLFDYMTIVTAKHRAVRKQDYTTASQFRDKENHYMDMSYEWLFSDDFSNRHAYRPYARYSSDLLIEELDYYFSNE
jgi:hypothetical protein